MVDVRRATWDSVGEQGITSHAVRPDQPSSRHHESTGRPVGSGAARCLPALALVDAPAWVLDQLNGLGSSIDGLFARAVDWLLGLSDGTSSTDDLTLPGPGVPDLGPYQIAIGAFIAFVILWMLLRPVQKAKPGVAEREPKYGSTSWFERFLTWIKPPPDAMEFGSILVSFKWLPHWLTIGAPGSGKSTFMRKRIIDLPLGLPGLIVMFCWMLTDWRWPKWKRKGKLILTGNRSKPFRAAVLWLIEHGMPGYVWTPDPTPGAGFGIDVLEGPPDSVAQRIIAMHPSGHGDTGLRSGAVEGMLVDTLYVIDRLGIPRNFQNILEKIWTVGIRNLDERGRPVGETRALTTQEKAGLDDWCTRLRALRRRLGASIGSDLKLSEAMRNGWTVLIEGSSYRNPNSTDQLMNLYVYLAMWLVTEVGHFDLIIDEAGAVGPSTYTRLLSATRAEEVSIGIGAQSRKQVDDTVREMCNTSLLLGAAPGATEAREFESRVTEGDVEPPDFVLLEPKRWYEWLMFWMPRRGLYSCEGYLLSNGRLDRVKTPYCDLEILKRWPIGTIPALPASPSPDVDGPLPTGNGVDGPLNSNALAESVSAMHPDVATSVAGEAELEREPGRAAVLTIVPRASESSCPERVMLDRDATRLWGKGLSFECWTPGLKRAHRFWQGGNNGQASARPKAAARYLSGEDVGQRATVTVYVWWYEFIAGGPIPAERPQIDHVCHTFDDTCPGPNLCKTPGCEDPAHPEGEPCQHTRCYEFEHLEPVTGKVNARRQADQRRRHREWLKLQRRAA